ncbi:MAG: VOC family protein [Pseudomonadota bacterium]
MSGSGMLSHFMLGTNDLPAATAFYDKVLGALGLNRVVEGDWAIAYACATEEGPRFWVCSPFDEKPATVGNGTHVAFLAPSRDAVDAFHRFALESGGADEGKPGLRPHYSENYYGAYVRDLDGNKIQAVCYAVE